MAHIQIDNELPGIMGLAFQRPRIGKAANRIAQAALRGPSPLSPGQRELIAAYVSALNDCGFCTNGHAATATQLLQDDGAAAACVIAGSPQNGSLDPKMRALLHIAMKVQRNGKEVQSTDIEKARAVGATDDEIHDTVLVAALFCFFNRYVDGLGTYTPTSEEFYREGGKFLSKHGYGAPNPIGKYFATRMVRKTGATPHGNSP